MKPANLLLAADSTVKVADFGLARPAGGSDHQLTRQGQMLGTPYYMSPEQCESHELDHRSDIYSAQLYLRLVTGVNPYGEEDSLVRICRPIAAGMF